MTGGLIIQLQNVKETSDEIIVYMDKKRLSLPRKYSWYERKNNKKGD